MHMQNPPHLSPVLTRGEGPLCHWNRHQQAPLRQGPKPLETSNPKLRYTNAPRLTTNVTRLHVQVWSGQSQFFFDLLIRCD